MSAYLFFKAIWAPIQPWIADRFPVKEKETIMDTFELPHSSNFPKLEWKGEWEGQIILDAWNGF